MSKMKHLLRKLHLGGGGGAAAAAGIDHDRLLPPADPKPSFSPIASPDPPNSSSPATSSPPSSVSSRGAVSDAGSGARLEASAAAGPSGGGSNFTLFEEEYQVQLALALSASDPDGVEDLDSVQMKAAKRMSLVSSAAEEAGVRSGGGEDNMMEFLSLRYWVSLQPLVFFSSSEFGVFLIDFRPRYTICILLSNLQYRTQLTGFTHIYRTLYANKFVLLLRNSLSFCGVMMLLQFGICAEGSFYPENVHCRHTCTLEYLQLKGIC